MMGPYYIAEHMCDHTLRSRYAHREGVTVHSSHFLIRCDSSTHHPLFNTPTRAHLCSHVPRVAMRPASCRTMLCPRCHHHAHAHTAELVLGLEQRLGQAISHHLGGVDVLEPHLATPSALTCELVRHVDVLGTLASDGVAQQLEGALVVGVDSRRVQAQVEI